MSPAGAVRPAPQIADGARPAWATAGWYAVVLAYGAGLWLQVFHAHEGAAERGEPPFVLHWLRDASLGLVPTSLAVYVALLLLARLPSSRRQLAGGRATLTVIVVAVAASAVTALGVPVHAALFEAAEALPDDHAPAPLGAAHMLRDGLEILRVDVPLAALVSVALERAGSRRRRTAGTAEPPLAVPAER